MLILGRVATCMHVLSYLLFSLSLSQTTFTTFNYFPTATQNNNHGGCY
jgi:hypothetical protein